MTKNAMYMLITGLMVSNYHCTSKFQFTVVKLDAIHLALQHNRFKRTPMDFEMLCQSESGYVWINCRLNCLTIYTTSLIFHKYARVDVDYTLILHRIIGLMSNWRLYYVLCNPGWFSLESKYIHYIRRSEIVKHGVDFQSRRKNMGRYWRTQN